MVVRRVLLRTPNRGVDSKGWYLLVDAHSNVGAVGKIERNASSVCVRVNIPLLPLSLSEAVIPLKS